MERRCFSRYSTGTCLETRGSTSRSGTQETYEGANSSVRRRSACLTNTVRFYGETSAFPYAHARRGNRDSAVGLETTSTSTEWGDMNILESRLKSMSTVISSGGLAGQTDVCRIAQIRSVQRAEQYAQGWMDIHVELPMFSAPVMFREQTPVSSAPSTTPRWDQLIWLVDSEVNMGLEKLPRSASIRSSRAAPPRRSGPRSETERNEKRSRRRLFACHPLACLAQSTTPCCGSFVLFARGIRRAHQVP